MSESALRRAAIVGPSAKSIPTSRRATSTPAMNPVLIPTASSVDQKLRPGLMIRNALLRALRDSGKYQRVLESGSSIGGAYLLHGKLNEFDEVDQASIQTK